MANTHETLTSLFTDIADAIRDKTGGSEEIVADDFPTAISEIPTGGSATINGAEFECGEFTLTEAYTSSTGYVVNHSLGVIPSAVFLWVCNPSYETRGIVGKYRTDTTTSINGVSILAVNTDISSSTGASGTRFRIEYTNSTISFYCDSIYPLLPNMRYQWLAIGTEVP